MPTFNEIKKQRSNFTQCMHLPLFLPIVSDSLDNTHSPQYVQACVEFSLARWVGSEQVAACAALKRRRNGKKMERRKENQWDIFASHWQKMMRLFHPSSTFFGRDDCELHYAFSSLSSGFAAFLRARKNSYCLSKIICNVDISMTRGLDPREEPAPP